MELILKQNIPNLGYKDDLVSVKDGYGRNYLIPQGLAILATASEKKVREENLRQKSHKLEKVKQEATDLAAKLESLTVKVGAKVGEKGKIFGSVNNLQVADAIKKLGHDIDRKNVVVKDEPIKEIGTYEAELNLHRDVTVTVKFEVVEE